MSQENNWWAQLLNEKVLGVINAYHVFRSSKDVKDFDYAELLQEELNETYGMSLNLIGEIARAYNWERLSQKYKKS